MPNFPDRLEPGAPFPLGAHWDGLGVNFTVFSAHASRIQLCVFDSAGRKEIHRCDLPEYTNEIWHGYLPDAMPGLVYGFRAHGPYEPHNGHRFNAHKLLLDPYARGLLGTLKWTDAAFGYRVQSSRADLSFDRRDSAPAMVKSVVVNESFDWSEDRRPNTPWRDTIIYEAHVRGLTKLLEEVRPPERGTFAALCHPFTIDRLKRLGVTAVELMPVHAHLQDRDLVQKKLSNYWGYNTLSYFAVEPRYLSTGNANQARMAIRKLHAAGIEVILDVVYNHTCEGSELGPTLCWRGLDNASYYRLLESDRRYSVNDTGTGNTLNFAHPRVVQMVMDSLRYWARSFRVDGFRFDLGVTLGRETHGFDRGAGFFDALCQDPELSRLKLISEPWDLGPGGYQLGNHPAAFAEWNDRYRDSVRRYWRGDPGIRPELARRLSGSADFFGAGGARKPWASINFVASHDGMTLNDLVTYSRKHNEENLLNNNDGQSDDYSGNWGVEGPTSEPHISTVRERVKRSILVTLFASLGTPMLLAGDEIGRTQFGNNNAYCQDNEISWLNWNQALSSAGRQLSGFVNRLAMIRRTHPAFRARHFLHGFEQIAPGILDIDWFDERGVRLSPNDWRNNEGRALTMGLAGRNGENPAEFLVLMLNASDRPLDFTLPGPYRWRVLIDSADPEIEEHDLADSTYLVQDRAAAIAVATIAVKAER